MSSTSPTFTRSEHLVELIAEVERLATMLTTRVAGDDLVDERVTAGVRATLALDGADAELLPDLAEATRLAAEVTPGTVVAVDRPGTWLDALRVLDDPRDDEIRALEVVGAHAADASDDLTEQLLTDPLPALAELHRRTTRGLVDADRAGRARITELAVQDGSTGRVLFFPPLPDAVPRELALTAAWLASTGTREHGLIASGVLQHELLRIHPFDAANGRLARAAARLVLRARGLDPFHVAAPEPELARDLLGYHEEVARTLRRRDLTIWLERWGEAVADGLREAARRMGALDTEVPADATAFLAANPAFTVAEYRAQLGVNSQASRAALGVLLDVGVIRRVPGSSGLRFVAAA